MEKLVKVFIETSTLIAASIRYNQKYTHKFYDNSKALFNFFANYISKQIGITSDTVIEQAKSKLEKAIGDLIYETEGSDFKMQDTEKYYETVAKIKETADDVLRKNIRLLGKVPIDEIELTKIKNTEVVPFFNEIENELQQREKIHIGIKLPRDLIKTIEKRNKPYFKGLPDHNDIEILSEAIYIKRTFFKTEKFFIASLDTHFSPTQKDSTVRDKIKEKFSIVCDWPKTIFEEIKKENR